MAADERWRAGGDGPRTGARVQVAALAAHRHGRVTDAQLRELGIGGETARYWRRTSYLHRTLPRVFAVGSTDRTYESELLEAILYAGPNAMLSHMSAAHWLGLIDHPPRAIHVSTPRRVASLPGVVVVHARRRLQRASHLGIPVTSAAQTMRALSAPALGAGRWARRALGAGRGGRWARGVRRLRW